MHPSKDLKVRKIIKEMDNGEAMEVVEALKEEEVIPIISTMKTKVTQSFRGRGRGQRGGR